MYYVDGMGYVPCIRKKPWFPKALNALCGSAHYVKYFYGSDSTSDVPGYCKMEKTGQIVTVSFAWSKNSNGQSGTTLATLPENARPVIRTVGACVSMGTNNFGQVTINPNGKIAITSAVNSSYFAGSVTFYAA